MKTKTNKQAFKKLINTLDPQLLALLRERILAVCEWTAEETHTHPVAIGLYQELNKQVQLYLGTGA